MGQWYVRGGKGGIANLSHIVRIERGVLCSDQLPISTFIELLDDARHHGNIHICKS